MRSCIRLFVCALAAIALAALVVEYALALLLGIAAARRPGSGLDHAIRVGGLLLYSLPIFWLGLMAVLLFAYLWPVLPSSHMHSVDVDLMSRGRRLLDGVLPGHLMEPVAGARRRPPAAAPRPP